MAEQALEGVRHARAGTVVSIRLHGDRHAGNVPGTDEGPHFVDFGRPPHTAVQTCGVRRGERADMTQHRLATCSARRFLWSSLIGAKMHLWRRCAPAPYPLLSAPLAWRWGRPGLSRGFPPRFNTSTLLADWIRIARAGRSDGRNRRGLILRSGRRRAAPRWSEAEIS
ncbi:MAG: hypothetical protein M5R42_05475 [Rhodocyclaceae bacterium]|nr:hypothetical protein [Rhodocyclaceae bacterium]